jgi:1-acyl-sn-glycerol-3-phosphate acyltransferase
MNRRQHFSASQSYRMSLSYLLAMLISVLTGRRRSFSADARWLLGRLAVPPRIVGEEHVPARGPFIVIANHYQHPGLWIAWGAYLISMAVAPRRLESSEVRWAMAGEWRAHLAGPIPWPAPFLRWLFRRIAATYGHIVVPAADFMSVGRAQAARAMLRALRPPDGGVMPAPLGLFPEGRNSPDCSLRRPDRSIGRLLLHLCRENVPVLPAAIREVDGALTVTFGPPVSLEPFRGENDDAADAALDEVMLAVARLLPFSMHGAYADRAQGEGPPVG